MLHHRGSPKQQSQSGQRTKPRTAALFIRDLVVIVVAAIIISVGIKTFLIRSFYVPSSSMNTTLAVNDRIIVNELVPRVVPVQRGDVIVFSDPGGWLPTTPIVRQGGLAGAIDGVLSAVGLSVSDSNNHLVKRVFGLPGDTVACCTSTGRMTVNGIALDETNYVNLPAGAPASLRPFSAVVPPKSLWVMGDNRNNSADSRFHVGLPTKGFVPYSDVVGRAIAISWPADRWTWLDNYPRMYRAVAKN